MNTPSDIVKYYQIPVPLSNTNLNVTISLSIQTPGFMPSFYMLRNDIYNGSFSYSSLSYPSSSNFTQALEGSFLNP
jgi:hypothetical protein